MPWLNAIILGLKPDIWNDTDPTEKVHIRPEPSWQFPNEFTSFEVRTMNLLNASYITQQKHALPKLM